MKGISKPFLLGALLAFWISMPLFGQVIFKSSFEASDIYHIAPDKPEFVLAVSTSPNSAKLAWLEGSDNLTPSSGLTYRLHYSTQPGFLPDANSLLTELVNETSTEVSGLNAATAYFFRLSVMDSDGNIGSFSDEISTITAAADTQIHPTANWARAQQDLQLGPVLLSTENSLVFAILPESTLPEIGQILVGEDELGEGYLRRMLSVGSPLNGELTVTTEPATFADIVESTNIDSNLVLFDVVEQPGGQLNLTNQTIVATNRMEWKDRLLIAEQINQAPREGLSLDAQHSSTVPKGLSSPQSLAVSTDDELHVYHPSNVVTKAGETVNFEVSATVDAIFDDAFEPDWDIEFFSFVEMTHPNRISDNNFGATFTETGSTASVGGLRTIRKGIFSWDTVESDADYIAYTAAFNIQAKKKKCTLFCPRREVNIEVDISVDQQGRYIVTSSSSEEMGVSLDLNFVPDLVTHLELDSDGINLAEVYMHGTAVFDALAYYRFKGSESFTVEKPIFTRTYHSLYTAGPVPIYQEVTLSAQIQFSADASVAIEANAEAILQFDFDLGARYSRLGGWEDISDYTTTKSLTIDLGVQGAVNAEIRLIPNIQIKFYKTAFAGFSLEPYLEGHLAAELIAEADLLNLDAYGQYRMTQLDAGFGLEGKFYAGLKVFDYTVLRYPETGSKSLFDWKFPIFSLPELSAQALTNPVTSCEPVMIQGGAIDGTNNPFDEASIHWATYPSDAAIAANMVDPFQAEFIAPTAGTYKVFFIGKGEELGNIARQFEVLELTAEEGTGTCITLAVTKEGSGSGAVISQPEGINCGSSCSYKYATDQLVTLVAEPDVDSIFSGWNGAGCSGTGDCVIAMDASKNVVATFERNVDTVIQIDTPSDLFVVPEGGTAQFQVRLTSQPENDVTILVTKNDGDPDLSVQTGDNLHFTTSNWNEYQTVTLAAAEDDDKTDGSAIFRLSISGLGPTILTAKERDNDALLSFSYEGVIGATDDPLGLNGGSFSVEFSVPRDALAFTKRNTVILGHDYEMSGHDVSGRIEVTGTASNDGVYENARIVVWQYESETGDSLISVYPQSVFDSPCLGGVIGCFHSFEMGSFLPLDLLHEIQPEALISTYIYRCNDVYYRKSNVLLEAVLNTQ